MIRLSNILAHVLVGLIRAYQYLLSPWLGPRCRYTPSCSAYAVEAIRIHGSIRGVWLAIKRVARCHPWANFGYDPVPTARVGRYRKSLPE